MAYVVPTTSFRLTTTNRVFFSQSAARSNLPVRSLIATLAHSKVDTVSASGVERKNKKIPALATATALAVVLTLASPHLAWGLSGGSVSEGTFNSGDYKVRRP